MKYFKLLALQRIVVKANNNASYYIYLREIIHPTCHFSDGFGPKPLGPEEEIQNDVLRMKNYILIQAQSANYRNVF